MPGSQGTSNFSHPANQRYSVFTAYEYYYRASREIPAWYIPSRFIIRVLFSIGVASKRT